MGINAELRAAIGAVDFTPGYLLRRTFSIWGRNLPAITVLCTLLYAPVAAVWALPGFGVPIEVLVSNRFSNLLLSTGLVLCVGSVASGVVAEELRGGRGGLGALLRALAHRGPALVPVALVTSLLVTVGFVALLVPGIWARLVLWLAGPAIAVERCGVIAALRRSRELTRGRLGAIFGTLFVLNLLDRGIVAVSGALGAAVASEDGWLTWAIAHLAVAFSIGPLAVASAIAYHELRGSSGPSEAGELAKVFE